MTQDQKEIYEAVEMLNDNLIELYEEKYKTDRNIFDNLPRFYATTYLGEISVEVYFPRIDTTVPLYNSESEDREFNEELNCYEPFCDYVQKKFKLIKEEINSIAI